MRKISALLFSLVFLGQMSWAVSEREECIRTSCRYLGAFACNDKTTLIEVTNRCEFVQSRCIVKLCHKVGHFACREQNEIYSVLEACRGLVDLGCVDEVCSRLSRFGCSEIGQVTEVARSCR